MFLQSHFNFILFFQSAFNIYSQFKTSCLPVTAPIWVCLDLTSDIHHLFASFCSLTKAQVRKNHQQAEPTGPLCIKDSITAMAIQERLPRNLSDNNAQRGKSRRKKAYVPLNLTHPEWNTVPSRQAFLTWFRQTEGSVCPDFEIKARIETRL